MLQECTSETTYWKELCQAGIPLTPFWEGDGERKRARTFTFARINYLLVRVIEQAKLSIEGL